MLIRLGVLADRIVGRAPGGKRRAVRWPEELLDYKKDHNARTAKSVAGTLIGAISCMLFAIACSCDSPELVGACLFLGIISFFILPPLLRRATCTGRPNQPSGRCLKKTA